MTEAAAPEVAAALARAGVRSILLKGTSTQRLVYGGDFRLQGDVDLLVAPATWERAVATLSDLGFAGPPKLPARAAAFCRADGVSVDLHWSVNLGDVDSRCWDVLAAHTVVETVWGRPVEMLTPPARLVIIALHAAQHGRSTPKPIEDLRRAVEVMPLSDWMAARPIAADLGVLDRMAMGLELVEAETLIESLALPATVPRSLWLHANAFPVGSTMLARARELGWPARLRLIRHLVAPPAEQLRTLRWSKAVIEYPGGVALATIARWIRVALLAPGAIRAYVRGRRLHGRTIDRNGPA